MYRKKKQQYIALILYLPMSFISIPFFFQYFKKTDKLSENVLQKNGAG